MVPAAAALLHDLDHNMISIIIPVLNEEKRIEALLEHAAALPGDKEIIVVDGGSADRTAELAAHRAVVIEGACGRGPQCNAGARMAHGDIFFFLHADSRLELNALGEIERAVAQGASWGCLKLCFGGGHWFGRIVALCSNLRARWRGLVFGDQGIFMSRGLFGQLEGFRELPLMEDYQLSLDLKKRGIAPRQIDSRIVTSARRFTSGGWLRTLWQMRRLRALYRQGVDIGEIMGCYQDAR